MSTDEQVLELSALTPNRQKARVRTEKNPEGLRPDGELYEIRVPEEMSTRQLRVIMERIVALQELMPVSKTDADDAKVTKLLNGVASALIVDAPAALIKSMNELTKSGLAMGFFVRAGTITGEAAGTEVVALFSSASLSPASNGSTEETP